jgi:hypothetical protein
LLGWTLRWFHGGLVFRRLSWFGCWWSLFRVMDSFYWGITWTYWHLRRLT